MPARGPGPARTSFAPEFSHARIHSQPNSLPPKSPPPNPATNHRLPPQNESVTFDEFYAFLNKESSEKLKVFKPGEKIKLKEGHSVVL